MTCLQCWLHTVANGVSVGLKQSKGAGEAYGKYYSGVK